LGVDLTYYEFFAGGGMARSGLGASWHCLFANDFSNTKVSCYIENWGSDHVHLGDVAQLKTSQLPSRAKMAWASFPCQDLSLAGGNAGLGNLEDNVTRSGTFWHFWSNIKELTLEGRKPATIVLENVMGALTSSGGADFVAICNALADGGYLFGAVVIDAAHFVPQSRKRVFFVAVDKHSNFPHRLTTLEPTPIWHPTALTRAQKLLTGQSRNAWVWWNLPQPSKRTIELADIIEKSGPNITWNSKSETDRILTMMSEINREKVKQAQDIGKITVGAIYRRTRTDENGVKRQRAEVRFDGLAGCLRTPGGGSSRQTIMIIDGEQINTRLISSREAARLMGLPDSYKMPVRYNDAYHLAGDGVCVSVVRFLAEYLLEPILLTAHDKHPMAAE
jgi:DNA (cytosine-5)-methyltransferase 1